jgi:hypothetical protein
VRPIEEYGTVRGGACALRTFRFAVEQRTLFCNIQDNGIARPAARRRALAKLVV